MQFDCIEFGSTNNLSLFYLLLFVLGEWPPTEDMFLQLVLAIFIQNEQDATVRCYNRRIDVDFILQLKDGLLGDLFVLWEIINLHFVVLLYCVFILSLLANSSLKHKTSLRFTHFDNLLDNFIGQIMDDDFLLAFPH